MKHTLLVAAILLLSPAASASDWSFLANKDGVSTWTQAVPGSRLLGFRGEADVNVHASKLIAAMLNPDTAPEWVDLLSEHRVVSGAATQREVIYQRYGMTWPVQDRDLVLERTVTQFPEQRRTTVSIRSTTHPGAPEIPGVVRADVMQTFFSFTALPGGFTHVEVEAFTDPKGGVPLWLVNLVQKSWARNSINALAKVARKDTIRPYEPARSW